MSYRQFSELFGATRANTDLVGVARNACRNEFAMVAVRPGTKAPVCILADATRRKADKEAATAARDAGHRAWSRVRHPCGRNHAVTDPDVAARVFRRLVTRWPDTLNLAIEVGRSRMLLVDCDSATGVRAFTALWADREGIPDLATAAPTVRTPGKVHEKTGEWTHKDGGHFWFSLPDGVDFSDATVPPVYGDEFVIYFRDTIGLVPPSHRPEGAYQLASESGEAPEWLVAMVREHIEAATSQRRERRTTVLADGDPIDAWAASNTWEEILLPDGWEQTGRWSRCGCEEWTRPGEDWSNPKSATAHEVGCTAYDTASGHAPLHLWTDSPPEFLAAYVERTGRKTLTKLTYLAWRDHDGDAAAAMAALGVQARGGDYVSDDEVFAMTEPEAGGDQDDVEEKFWAARGELTVLRDFARARQVSPWAMLGCVLAVVAVQTGPHVVLPPAVGGVASLNLFIGLVGGSGAGKDSALAAALDFLWLRGEVPVHKLGTGQGVDSAFTEPTKNGPVQFNDAALFTAPEIDNLRAHAEMGGSNLLATLKDVYTGAKLGARYAKKENRRPVGAHRYRAAVVAGIQPTHAEVLLRDADGGTPQRWLWVPANDPSAPEQLPDEPVPLTWTVPAALAAQGEVETGVLRRDRVQVSVCQTAQAEAAAQRRRQLLSALQDGEGNLDAHSGLTRRKVATLLSLLDGRCEVGESDWELAGVVMEVSARTRKVCEDAVTGLARKANKAKALAEAERQELISDHAEKRVANRVLRILRDAGDWMTRKDLRSGKVAGRDRHLFDPAVARLLSAGLIEREQGDGGGEQYRAASK